MATRQARQDAVVTKQARQDAVVTKQARQDAVATKQARHIRHSCREEILSAGRSL